MSVRCSCCIYVGHHNRQKIRSRNMSEILSACWIVALFQFDRLILFDLAEVCIHCQLLNLICVCTFTFPWLAIKFWWALSTYIGTYHSCTLQRYSVRILSWINPYSKSRHCALANFIYTRAVWAVYKCPFGQLGSFKPLYLQIAVPNFQLSSTHCSFI